MLGLLSAHLITPLLSLLQEVQNNAKKLDELKFWKLLHSALFKYYDYVLVIFSLYGVFKTRLLLKQFVSMLMVYILRMINTNGMEDLYKIMTLTFVEGFKSRKWKLWDSSLKTTICSWSEKPKFHWKLGSTILIKVFNRLLNSTIEPLSISSSNVFPSLKMLYKMSQKSTLHTVLNNFLHCF